MEQQNEIPRSGLILLGLGVGGLLLAIALTDQKRTVGFDADRSLVASCAPGRAAVFTNGERQAVFVQKPDGRVAAQPVFRGEVISGIACDSQRGEIVVTTAHGEERVAVAAASADHRKQRSVP